MGRAYRSWNKVAAAIRAFPVKPVTDTIRAEGALEGTDHGLLAVRRQVAVAAFAVWPKFKHGLSNPVPVASRVSTRDVVLQLPLDIAQ